MSQIHESLPINHALFYRILLQLIQTAVSVKQTFIFYRKIPTLETSLFAGEEILC